MKNVYKNRKPDDKTVAYINHHLNRMSNTSDSMQKLCDKVKEEVAKNTNNNN